MKEIFMNNDTLNCVVNTLSESDDPDARQISKFVIEEVSKVIA